VKNFNEKLKLVVCE
jgi:hypothetical protein